MAAADSARLRRPRPLRGRPGHGAAPPGAAPAGGRATPSDTRAADTPAVPQRSLNETVPSSQCPPHAMCSAGPCAPGARLLMDAPRRRRIRPVVSSAGSGTGRASRIRPGGRRARSGGPVRGRGGGEVELQIERVAAKRVTATAFVATSRVHAFRAGGRWRGRADRKTRIHARLRPRTVLRSAPGLCGAVLTLPRAGQRPRPGSSSVPDRSCRTFR